MRIAYVAQSRIPSRNANSVQVMKMCAAFSGEGHSVSLVVPRFHDLESGVDPYAFYGVPKSFEILHVPTGIVRPPAHRFVFDAAQTCRKLEPDLVYCRSLKAAVALSLFRIPVALEIHAIPGGRDRVLFDLQLRLLRKRHLRRAVVISQALESEFLKTDRLPAHLLRVAHDAAETATGGKCLQLGDSNRLQVGYVGQLIPGKGIELIIDLAARCPWADFHVVGGNESDVSRWRSAAEVATNVTFHGFVPPSETDSYRRSCDVLLAPYQKHIPCADGSDLAFWMSPLKLFEYMASEKPIICSDIPVLREILEHEESALLCPPDDPDAWMDALRKIQDDPSLGSRIAQNALDQLRSRFTWSQRAKNVLDGIDVGSPIEAPC